jgi:hypothetical protein
LAPRASLLRLLSLSSVLARVVQDTVQGAEAACATPPGRTTRTLCCARLPGTMV